MVCTGCQQFRVGVDLLITAPLLQAFGHAEPPANPNSKHGAKYGYEGYCDNDLRTHRGELFWTHRGEHKHPRAIARITLLSMTSRSGRGRWQRVLEARKQAREALGRDPDADDPFNGPPKGKAASPAPSLRTVVPLHPSERSERVLTLGEAAARLGVRRAELEAMINAGTIEALPTGYSRTVPTREVERLETVKATTK
jgi:excisionase family DNA binding protein